MPEVLDLNNPDALIEQIARDLEARKGRPVRELPVGGPDGEPVIQQPEAVDPNAPPAEPAAAPAAPAAPPATPVAGAPPAAPAVDAEPFPGYNDLPEETRKHVDNLRAKAAEEARAAGRAELAPTVEQLRQDYTSIYNRLAPTQRALDEARRRVAGAPSAAAPAPVSIEAWYKKQSPERQAFYRDFPEEARHAYEIARQVAAETFAEHQQTTQQQLARIEQRAEAAQLAAIHPDYPRYTLTLQGHDAAGNEVWVAKTREGHDYWTWVGQQSEEIQRMADSNAGADIATVLSTYKWEKENPEFRETLALPEYQQWAAAMPPAVTQMVDSTNPNDRRYVLSLFWRDYDEATAGAAAKPEAQRAQSIAERRAEQAKRVAPSVRSTASPAPSSAAPAGSDDAVIESVWQQRQARRAAAGG